MGQAKSRGSFDQRKLEAIKAETERLATLAKEKEIARLERLEWEAENPELAAKQKRKSNEFKQLLAAVAAGMSLWKY